MKLSFFLRAQQNQLMQLSELFTLTCKVCASAAGVPWGVYGIHTALRAVLAAAVYLPLVVIGCIRTSRPGLRGRRWREVWHVLW